MLAAAVQHSGLKVDAKTQAEAAKAMAPMVEQLGVIGDKAKEEQFIQGMAIGLKANKDLLARAASGGLSGSGLVLDVNTVAGTEAEKAVKIQKFAAFYGPMVWVKEKNWDGRLIEWVTFKHDGMNVKFPVSLIMDAPKLSGLEQYFFVYNNNGLQKKAAKQTITASPEMKAKVLAEEKAVATAAAAAAAAAAKAAATAPADTTATTGGGGGGMGGRGGGRGGGGRGGGGRGGRGGGMMGG